MKPVYKKQFNTSSHKRRDTSWNESSTWYNEIVGVSGHYYHTHVILPSVLELLGVNKDSRVLDIGCGQGVFARALPRGVAYLGIDAGDRLLQQARRMNKDPKKEFALHDATQTKQLTAQPFTHAVAILSLQNMKDPSSAIKLASQNLVKNGTFVMVINHPTFRIPRQSGWDTFVQNKLQFRWVSKYMSRLEIPFVTHLAGGRKIHSWSFHHPLSDYAAFLKQAGFVISDIQEWTSDKNSTGKHAKKENRAREEFPLFMAIVAAKK